MAKTSKAITEEYFCDNCTRDNLRRLLKQERKQEQERIKKIIEKEIQIEGNEVGVIDAHWNRGLIKYKKETWEADRGKRLRVIETLTELLSQIQKVDEQSLEKVASKYKNIMDIPHTEKELFEDQPSKNKE